MLYSIRNSVLFQDARNLQIIFLSSFLLFGIWFLEWETEPMNMLILFPTAIVVQVLAIKILKLPFDSIKSAAITSLGLTLLYKSDDYLILMLAAILAITSKFLIRFRGKHIFNPTNFGIVASMLLFNDGWISPGKWGSSVLLLLVIGSAGLMVLFKAGRIDTGISFLLTLFLLDFLRLIVYQGWELDVLFHKYMNGSLLLFSFFMITDPATTPNHKKARIIWAASIALISFLLQSFYQIQTAPFWTLFFVSPLTILFDMLLKARKFEWMPLRPANTIKLLLAVLMLSSFGIKESKAFCGFYVAQANAKLFNKSSQVIIVRDGTRSIISMHSDFQGAVRDFAMVVPVPVVLKRNEIRIINSSIFQSLDAYSGPRLVEYFDENPCYPRIVETYEMAVPTSAMRGMMLKEESVSAIRNKVVIEAQYTVGEYDILLLSAKESNGLKNWLTENNYQIPEGAEEVLDPYIKNNMKFFVVKVNLDEQKKLGFNELRPIQISFDSPKFMLPIRLGMANANGDQDMIVYAFSKKGRIECTNYITKKMPTGKQVPLDVESRFGEFYKDVFEKTWARHKDAAYLEYAWNVTPSWGGMKCDPCTGPPPLTADLSEAGVLWASNGSGEQVYFSRLHFRYGRSYFPQDLLFQETPNKENYQARYIITHPAQGDLSCEAGQKYIYDLTRRRQTEVQNAFAMAGWSGRQYNYYMNEYVNKVEDENMRKNLMVPSIPDNDSGNGGDGGSFWQKIIFSLILMTMVIFIIAFQRAYKPQKM